MNILYITPMYPNKYQTTSNIFFQDIAETMAELKTNKISVIAPIPIKWNWIKDSLLRRNKSENCLDYSNNITVYRHLFYTLPRALFIVNIFRLYYGKRLFQKYVKKHGLPDIIHIQTYLVSPLAIYLNKKYKVPIVYTEHYSTFYNNKISLNIHKYVIKLLDVSTKVITVSNALSKRFKELYNIDTTTIYNVVDSSFFTFTEKHISNSKYIFLSIGHLTINKNQISIIRTFLNRFKGNTKYLLRIGGYGDQYSSISDFITKNDTCNQITLLGPLNRSEVLKEYQRANCFVLSSFYETFGVVLIEAMSCGLPVISSKCGGAEEIITNDKLGVLYENSDEQLLIAFDKHLNTSYDKEFIRNYAIKHYSKETISRQLNIIYEEVINGK